jgi:hypothetical protein
MVQLYIWMFDYLSYEMYVSVRFNLLFFRFEEALDWSRVLFPHNLKQVVKKSKLFDEQNCFFETIQSLQLPCAIDYTFLPSPIRISLGLFLKDLEFHQPVF